MPAYGRRPAQDVRDVIEILGNFEEGCRDCAHGRKGGTVDEQRIRREKMCVLVGIDRVGDLQARQ